MKYKITITSMETYEVTVNPADFDISFSPDFKEAAIQFVYSEGWEKSFPRCSVALLGDVEEIEVEGPIYNEEH